MKQIAIVLAAVLCLSAYGKFGAAMPEESVSFCVPLGDFKVVKEPVTFDLNVPVPYNEEVLHCRFTSPYCLK